MLYYLRHEQIGVGGIELALQINQFVLISVLTYVQSIDLGVHHHSRAMYLVHVLGHILQLALEAVALEEGVVAMLLQEFDDVLLGHLGQLLLLPGRRNLRLLHLLYSTRADQRSLNQDFFFSLLLFSLKSQKKSEVTSHTIARR
jgi:hypothetical protein